MIIHPPAYNIALRPYYVHMTATQDSRNDKLAAAYLLDYIENAEAPTSERWAALRIQDLYDALSPFVANRPVWNALNWLEADGLIECRHDPDKPMNRTKQYRLRESEVQKRIDCWAAQNQALNYAQRCISSIYAQPQNMHNDGVEDMSKVHAGSSVLNSNTQYKPNRVSVGNHYELTMTTITTMLGCEVFPVKGKHPSPQEPNGSEWAWGRNRLGKVGIQPATPYAWQQATGYGMLPIKGDRLVFLDIDDELFEQKAITLIPRLCETYRQARSNHSCYAVRLHHEIEGRYSLKGEQGEIASLRNHGSYQVGAGSLHPSGMQYVATNMVAPIELSEVETRLLIGMFDQDRVVTSKYPAFKIGTRPNHISIPDKMVKRTNKWVAEGIRRVLEKLGQTGQGSFNDTLYSAALRVTALSRYGSEPLNGLINQIWDICETSGYVRRDGVGQTRATIRNGVKAGANATVLLPKWLEDAIAKQRIGA